MNTQRGSALLSALFIMTLVAIAATSISIRVNMDIYRTQLNIDADQLYLKAQLLNYWAIDTLKHKPFPRKRFVVFSWPPESEALDIQFGAKLIDLQSRFNLNNLTNPLQSKGFAKFLKQALPDLSTVQAQKIAKNTHEWLSAQLFQTVSEFRLIKGVSASLYQAVLPSISALPTNTPVNINTAPRIVLMGLGKGLNPAQVALILKMRGKKGFRKDSDLTSILKDLAISPELVTRQSQFFQNEGFVSYHDLNLTIYTILKCFKDKEKNTQVRVLSTRLHSL